MTLPEQRILCSLKWSRDRCLTVDGTLKTVRSALVPTRHRFWKIWRTKSLELKRDGYSLKKPDLNFIVTHWQTLERSTPQQEMAR